MERHVTALAGQGTGLAGRLSLGIVNAVAVGNSFSAVLTPFIGTSSAGWGGLCPAGCRQRSGRWGLRREVAAIQRRQSGLKDQM